MPRDPLGPPDEHARAIPDAEFIDARPARTDPPPRCACICCVDPAAPGARLCAACESRCLPALRLLHAFPGAVIELIQAAPTAPGALAPGAVGDARAREVAAFAGGLLGSFVGGLRRR